MKQERRINGISLFWLLWGIYVVILAALFIYAQYAQRGTVNNPILNGDSTEIDLNGNVNQETESETTDQYCLHIRVKILKEISATCTNSGLTEGVICADCGEIIVEQIATARSTEHSFGEWLESSGRCSDIPYHFRVCRVCGEKEYDLTFTGVSHPCDYEFDLKEPTCIEDGYQKLVCKNCGYKAVDEIIEATGHDLKWTVDESTHSAYCKNQGCDYIISTATHMPSSSSVCVNTYCTVCDYLIKEGIGHNLSTEYLYDANSHWQACKNDNCNYTANYHRHINNSATCDDQTALCNICGSEFVPKVNHVYGSWYIAEEPTCTKKGLERRDCVYCNNYEERNTEATGHSCNNWNVTVEPTCIDYGIKKGFCNSCNAEIFEKISPLGHSCQDWTVTKDMTCTEDGERIGRCSRCNKEFTEVIKAKHSWSDTYSANDVSHWYVCLICNGTNSMEAHYGDGLCGSRAICSACGSEYGDIIQHDFSTSVSYNESSHYNLCNRGCGTQANVEVHQLIGKTETMTITDAGGEVVYSHKLYLVCNGCDYKRLYDETEAHEHYGCEVYESVAPTCTETGLTFGWGCSVSGCDEVYKEQDVIDALGHNYVNNVCTRCGATLIPSEGLKYTSNGDGTCYVSGIGTCTDTEILIPSVSPDGYSVTSIGDLAFYGCSSLTSITIPDSVTSIGYWAFEDCSSLTSITIPDSVTSIGDGAFSGCSSLTYNEFDNALYFGNENNPNIVLVKATNISITSCEINSNTKFIDYGAFEDCNNLTSITIPDGVTSIGQYAFSDCSSLASVVFGENSQLTSIGYRAFRGCSSLTSITIPDSVTCIDPDAFYGCLSVIQIENGISYVDKWVIDCDTTITQAVLRENTVGIGGEAFWGCSSLTSITIPDSVTTIGYDAFRDCSSLTSITIPDSVTSIGEHAFTDCCSLTSITIPFVGGTKDGTTSFDYIFSTGHVVHRVPDSLKIVIITGGTSISDDAFQGCSSLTSITIPDSVTSIGSDAFSGCSSLTSITIPDSVTSIGDDAFKHCCNLTSINIPDSVTSIGEHAFIGCYKLIEVYNLSSLNITACSSSNGYVGYYAKNVYTDESGVSKLVEKDGYIFYCDDDTGEYYLMEYRGSDTELDLPDDINGHDYEIYQYAFYYRDDITSINIPDGVTSIGDYAFRGCSSLTSVEFGENSQLTSIGYHAFDGCSSLTSITIPNSVTSIGKYAFYGCSSLTSVSFEDTTTEWYVSKSSTATSGTNISVADAATNATYLKSTYYSYYWFKK